MDAGAGQPSPAAESDTAAALSSELVALRAQQEALLRRLHHRNLVTDQQLNGVDEMFSQVPAYAAKLSALRRTMDELAARTSGMRTRCEKLQSDA
jgi:hypothetical protein